jgi:hypothetical protein
MGVVEWVAKRTWHVLGLPYSRKDYQGPPEMRVEREDGWVTVSGTVADAGVPCRNQVISCEIEQLDEPVLAYVRSTDAFGEVLMELDLLGGTARARSVTVHRTMSGGQAAAHTEEDCPCGSHSSPMPEQSSNRVIREDTFQPVDSMPVQLKILTQGSRVVVSANDSEIFRFQDPDPAGGHFGFGSVGTIRVRNVEQWELISPEEKARREACIEQIHEFCKDIDAYYENDVRERNEVRATGNGLLWTWPATGATADFRVEKGRVLAKVGAGLYGNDTLVNGAFPAVVMTDEDGETFRADEDGTAGVEGDDLGIRMRLPLKSESGKKATAKILAKLTVQTIWFWTIEIEGAVPKTIEAYIAMTPEFAMSKEALESSPDAMFGLKQKTGNAVIRHNAKAGFYAKLIVPENTVLGEGTNGSLGFSTTDPRLRFATVVLPVQPLNMVGFKNRMVHFIRYPEGPIQHWRRAPSYQEYPNDNDLARYAGNGTGAMVWHHTWLSNDYRNREGFMVNHDEMKRAMDGTHRHGMKMIGYLGILPGRNALLRYEDTCPLGGHPTYGDYDKNWDLQDHTFYHVNGRYPEFLAWMTDYFCKEYGLDGYYLDGGSFGQLSPGATTRPYHEEDADLTLEEIRHRAYYRVKKVLELNGAGYGLEPWSGLDWMLNGFYDCMMIGESFQEADVDYYRNGHNALLTGCMVKMYGMRASSQNPYNIAMAAINLSDIQVCSGNGSWGNYPDTTETWDRVRPLWDLLNSIDWDHLVEARPWYAQELVSGDGFYAGNYTEPDRVLVFLANKTEEAGTFTVTMDPERLPEIEGKWRARFVLGRDGDIGVLDELSLEVDLPALHDGPVGIELVPAE